MAHVNFMNDKKETFYTKLKDRLDATTEFPTEYFYKFIVPTDENQVKEVEELFENKMPKISTRKSKSGKYISVSIRVNQSSSDEIISYYKRAEKINGIISL